MSDVQVVVLRTAGTNCDQETGFAFASFGARVDFVHINSIFKKERQLEDYHILAIPGGFSYGDDIAAGKILANELRLKLGKSLQKFIEDGKLMIGICNGFQILVKAGVLPGIREDQNTQQATLMFNDSGKFEDRWVHLKPQGRCVWTEGLDHPIYLPVAHGEGKFIPKDRSILKKINDGNQVVFRYCGMNGRAPVYPENPNGSLEDIAGITDPTGRVLGLMPHPERHFVFTQHPFWTRLKNKSKFGDGAKIFENGVKYVREKLLKYGSGDRVKGKGEH